MKLVAAKKLEATWVKTPQGFAVLRANAPLKTPAGNEVIVPTEVLAQAIVAEWQGQGDRVRKELLKFTPLACVAIDLAAQKRDAVLSDIVPYIDTDTVCYRAGDAEELLKQQQDLIDPILLWGKERFGIELAVTGGVMPIAQPPENSKKLAAILTSYDSWKLAAFSVAVKPLGSALLALALVEERLGAAEAFRLAHLEESFETGKWGIDEEKEKHLRAKNEDVQAVERFLALLKS